MDLEILLKQYDTTLTQYNQLNSEYLTYTKNTSVADLNKDLISVSNMNTQESNLKENDVISTADIRSELFDGENIITGQTDNGQSKLVSGPFVTK